MTIIDETDERFFVQASTIDGAGRGLFAKQRLSVGDRLKVPGVLIVPGSTADVCTEFADEHKFRVGMHLLIPVGLGAMVNHSMTPNLEKHVKDGVLYLRVVREVESGEELFFSYSAYARERFGLP